MQTTTKSSLLFLAGLLIGGFGVYFITNSQNVKYNVLEDSNTVGSIFGTQSASETGVTTNYQFKECTTVECENAVKEIAKNLESKTSSIGVGGVLNRFGRVNRNEIDTLKEKNQIKEVADTFVSQVNYRDYDVEIEKVLYNSKTCTNLSCVQQCERAGGEVGTCETNCAGASRCEKIKKQTDREGKSYLEYFKLQEIRVPEKQ